ncbi:MAG: primosomal protein N' [endosymbiont of Galathealinum brachiosum]|uniref:Replication restart protein PriA n=1 Tax=endosymbiont of Galathealinum brachiosum TaxID=2200906 RepID=A0A370DEG6_9GAMM|nr:MAG: primosomal protein N' [endosymbiont of Galathealinum brachiosum]
MSHSIIARIAVPVPLYSLFDYLVPVTFSHPPVAGARVRVQFGRKQLIGMVVSLESESMFPVSKLKPVLDIVDDQPLLPAEIIKLLKWAASYYHHPLGDVLFSALPKRLREGAAAELKSENHWVLTESGNKVDVNELKRAPKQAALLAYFKNSAKSEVISSQLNEDWDNWRSPLQSLVDKSLVEIIEKVQTAIAPLSNVSNDRLPEKPELNSEQENAAREVIGVLNSYQTFLLQGITGSGKTEVYLEIIEHALAQNLQVLVLVPEISLTPQLTQRFTKRLNTIIASLHSGLNDTQRHSAWVQASKGVARVVIGTRSALFTPMPDLGLIILDEEHDASFKQQEGFRYHARDLALVRAKNKNIPVLLGSATPSFESLENVSREQYSLLKLTKRGVLSARPPKVSLLDVCRRPMDDGISDKLFNKIEEHLNNDGQILLFLNRRGYAPLLMCHECGWTTACQRCDANMTLHHHNQRLRCHHCGYEKPAPTKCPECDHESLYIPGAGTERIEVALTEKFPSVVISRIDRDTTRRKGELDKKLNQARTGEARILIGTQMLAKGHDFPNVTLVGILNADQGLFSADFRGTEHMAQLIIQVSGRAGRGDKPGEVIIQTHHPEHPLLHTLLDSGYTGFAKTALIERKQASFPPFSYMVLVRCESMQKEHGIEFLNECRQALNYEEIETFGPLPAPMERRAGRYRWQLIILSKERKSLHSVLRQWVPGINKLKTVNKVRWSIDVDPQDMF